jgi:hypothetical protein
MVFHCHGRFDRPDSVVVTESDYQRWYVGDREGFGAHFREAIDLLFSSNPLLFVGYGLGDEDLLRPLRILGAVEGELKSRQPIFAVVPERKGENDWARHELLYERYGLNVIPYAAPEARDSREWGRALRHALTDLKDAHSRLLDDWLEKPAIRKATVPVTAPKPYRHYCLDLSEHEVLAASTVESKLEQLSEKASQGYQVLNLVGPGGTGKSWHAIHFMHRAEAASAYKGYFFWSSYYADDYLTGIDRALAYLDPEHTIQGARQERLAECLRRDRYLLIFDGIERLLRDDAEPGIGRPYGKGVEDLLRALSDSRSRSTVVLTTRLVPSGLNPEARIFEDHLAGLQPSDLERVSLYKPFRHEDISALCSLLDGHAYALLLAGLFLNRQLTEGVEEPARSLKRMLATVAPDRRITRMIQILVETLDHAPDGLAVKLLERLAVFMSPMTHRTIELCFELADKATAGSQRDLDSVLKQLIDNRLLFKVVGHSESLLAYTVHPTVRSYVFTRLHRSHSEALPNFTLPGFTSGTAGAEPGSREAAEMVKALFKRLLEEAEIAWREPGRRAQAKELCRGAFSVLRSRMEAITAPRWAKYEDYIRLNVDLAAMAKHMSPFRWDFRERHELQRVEDSEGVLFADELAWLYNDTGLAVCGEGNIVDCLAVWEQGFQINQVIAGADQGSQYIVQSLLHLAHTFIELGWLREAGEYLRRTTRANTLLGDDDYRGRITGYDAVIHHLRGDLETADKLYEEAINILENAGRNPRAQSKFHQHWADLAIALGNFDAAEGRLRNSRNLAEADRHPDLAAFARNANGHLCRARKKYDQARREYNAAFAAAQELGARRLEADVLSELSRLALAQGDAERARVLATQSMRLANELGLGLRQTHGLVILGLAAVQVGRRELGTAYLRQARRLAERQHYWLRAREAEKYLVRESAPARSEWPGR